jgi:hypothetical protein
MAWARVGAIAWQNEAASAAGEKVPQPLRRLRIVSQGLEIPGCVRHASIIAVIIVGRRPTRS